MRLEPLSKHSDHSDLICAVLGGHSTINLVPPAVPLKIPFYDTLKMSLFDGIHKQLKLLDRQYHDVSLKNDLFSAK